MSIETVLKRFASNRPVADSGYSFTDYTAKPKRPKFETIAYGDPRPAVIVLPNPKPVCW